MCFQPVSFRFLGWLSQPSWPGGELCEFLQMKRFGKRGSATSVPLPWWVSLEEHRMVSKLSLVKANWRRLFAVRRFYRLPKGHFRKPIGAKFASTFVR